MGSPTGNLEREKKYFVDEAEAEKLKKMSVARLGVAQWYLSDCSELLKQLGLKTWTLSAKASEGCRIRYTVTPNGEEGWVVAFKTDVRDDFTREEWEAEFEPFEDLRNFLTGQPVVVKVRYFLLFEPAEVVLDEFIRLERDYSVQVSHVVEVETDEPFERYEELFGLKKPMGIEDFKRYSNKNIAVQSKLGVDEIKALLFKALGDV
ncbi:hypothetical protein [Fervidobacterium thailandense]|uniref:CYTH domain-containing protein n=1 Tax=Fervidobacterium thailandense TaxID=1008305 RepID=A0A1E3G160_9BACT|nr:hypothetical protein [Fervidobacterium thailandense]ODN29965.1 hypothetical protein A4H02_07760 [Fervidobacterium thailandense]